MGIKSTVGDLTFWDQLTELMARADRGVDFVTIDGGEGGTRAAPMICTDSVSLPLQLGFTRVYRTFAERGLHEQVTFIGAGKLGLPDNAIVAFALGCDMVNVGREAMLAIRCIQALQCHTGERAGAHRRRGPSPHQASGQRVAAGRRGVSGLRRGGTLVQVGQREQERRRAVDDLAGHAGRRRPAVSRRASYRPGHVLRSSVPYWYEPLPRPSSTDASGAAHVADVDDVFG